MGGVPVDGRPNGTVGTMISTSLDGEVGRVLGGRYRIIAPIGRGASARVFLADDVTLRRRVAVKVLHEGLAADDAFLRRFRAEAQAAASLNNPHVLGVYDWGHDEVPYLVSEYLGGGSLRSMLEAGHRLSMSQALLVGLESARGLDYAHGQELVHRDIKPANLLFDETGRLRIADFGLARAIAEAGWTDQDGSLVGTARYAAPEQARGERVGLAADVFALALVINECVTGEVPFVGDTAISTLMARADTPFEPHSDLGPLQSVLRRAGALDPAERPSAGELAASLMASAGDLARPNPLPLVGPVVGDIGAIESTEHGTIHAVSPVADPIDTPADAGAGPQRRWPWAVLAAAAIAAGVAAGVVGWLNSRPVTHEIPEVVGATREQATIDLSEFGWELDFRSTREQGTDAGEVVGTDPVAGEQLEEGELLSVFVSLGEPTVTVPDLEGLSLDDARLRLENDGLVLGDVRQRDDELVAAGFVIEVVVGAGVTGLEAGSAIDVIVSSGPVQRSVPLVIEGLTEQVAAQQLLALRLIPGEDHAFSEDVPAGEVIRFEPSSGAVVEADTVVTVVISDGPEPREVPAVIGLDVDEATDILEAAGFVITGVQGSPSLPVLATDPPAGELHERGKTIVIATELTG